MNKDVNTELFSKQEEDNQISTEEALSNNKLQNTMQLLEDSESYSATLNKKLNNTNFLLNDKTSFLMESQNKLQKTNNFLKNGI